jgi:hypothetical protein
MKVTKQKLTVPCPLCGEIHDVEADVLIDDTEETQSVVGIARCANRCDMKFTIRYILSRGNMVNLFVERNLPKLSESEQVMLFVDMLKKKTCSRMDVDHKKLDSRSREGDLPFIRHMIFVFVKRKFPDLPLHRIGATLRTKFDHSTVIHAQKDIAKILESPNDGARRGIYLELEHELFNSN